MGVFDFCILFGSDKFDIDMPIEFVETYIEAQQNEASAVEMGRLAVWSVVPFGVAIWATAMST